MSMTEPTACDSSVHCAAFLSHLRIDFAHQPIFNFSKRKKNVHKNDTYYRFESEKFIPSLRCADERERDFISVEI